MFLLKKSALLLTVVFNNYLASLFTDILCNSTQIQERVYLPFLCYTLVLSSAAMEPSPKELCLCGYQSVLRLFHHSNHPRQLCFSRHAKFTSCRHCRVSNLLPSLSRIKFLCDTVSMFISRNHSLAQYKLAFH